MNQLRQIKTGKPVWWAGLSLALVFLGTGLLEAQVWGCKTCGTDEYKQLICKRYQGAGPEGGVECYAGEDCVEGRCFYWCYTQQGCVWV